MPKIDILITDTYRVLSFLVDNKDKDNLVKVTQNEIAEYLQMSYKKTNGLIKDLIENEYLIRDTAHMGRYILTQGGIKTVELFRKAEKK